MWSRHHGWLWASGLAGMLLFYGINNWHIMAGSTEQIINDHMSYFSFADTVLSCVRAGEWRALLFDHVPNVWKPPLFMIASAPFLLIQRSIEAAALANIFFLGVTMLCIFAVGKKLYGKAAGIMAAFLFGMVPNVFAMSRVLYIETALTAMVALTFYLFVVRRFRSVPAAAATGIVMGLGMLTKEPYALFVLPFFLYFTLPEGRREDAVHPPRVAVALAIAVLVASAWYLHQDRLSLDHYRWFVLHEYTSPDGLYYLKALFTRQLFPVFFVLFLLALAHSFRRKRFFLPAYCIFAVVLFSLANNRGDRYLLPVFPFVALLMGDAVVSWARGRKAVYAAAVLFCFLQYWLISYHPGPLFRVFPFLENGFPYNDLKNGGLYAVSPRQDDWKGPVSALLSGLDRYASDPSRPLSLVDLSAAGCELEYQVLTTRRNFRLEYPCRGLVRRQLAADELRRESESALARADVVVRSVPSLPVFFYWDQWPYLDEAFAKAAKDFRLVAQVPCPRGSTLLAYVRTVRPKAYTRT